MAVKFATVAKTKANEVAAQEVLEIAAKVDRLAELEVVLNAVESQRKEYDKLKKELVAKAEDLDAQQEVVFKGSTNKEVVLTAKAKQRTITSVAKLAAKLGTKTFMAIAKVTLADVDKYLAPSEQGDVVEEAQTGPRKFSIREVS